MASNISIDEHVMGGVPCIAGTRIPVVTIVGQLGQGRSIDDLLVAYPITRDDVLAALRFAAEVVDRQWTR